MKISTLIFLNKKFFNVHLLVLVQEGLFKTALIQFLQKFQQNLNILLEANLITETVFAKQRGFVQKLRDILIITFLMET